MDAQPFIARLAAIVGERHVIADPDDQQAYLTDWRGRYEGRAIAVVKPASTDEVAAVVRACVDVRVPMVPQGGNTGLCGGATPDGSGQAVVINLSRMNRVLTIDRSNNAATVQAGCTLHRLREASAASDRLFPLELASQGSCQIGGNLSTNAGGVHVLRYGNTRDLTLGLEVVLPDGQVMSSLRGLRKDNTGLDLKHLFIGAEGTLGIITAAVMKLFPLPKSTATAWVGVHSVESALGLLELARCASGDSLTAFELIGDLPLRLVEHHIPNARSPLAARAPWYVLVELSEASATANLDGRLASLLEGAMDRNLVGDAALAASLDQAHRLWSLRENISEAQRREGFSIKHDVSVPVDRIPTFIGRTSKALEDPFPGVRVVAFGHMGDGNIHFNLSSAEASANGELLARTPELNQIVHDIVDDLGGSISAEHGIGQLKRDELVRYKSPVELALMRQIKSALDPLGLMNPGKVLRA